MNTKRIIANGDCLEAASLLTGRQPSVPKIVTSEVLYGFYGAVMDVRMSKDTRMRYGIVLTRQLT